MGMNTSDVRDMPFGQWVYWATALPLTILVIALCLAWAGELNNFRQGFANLWRRNPSRYRIIQGGYERVRCDVWGEGKLRLRLGKDCYTFSAN